MRQRLFAEFCGSVNLFTVFGGVVFRRFVGMMFGVRGVTVRGLRVMTGGFVVAGFVLFCGFAVMFGRVFVMLGGVSVMFRAFVCCCHIFSSSLKR